MPLVMTTLRDGLRKYIDPDYSGYTGFPADAAAVGLAWGDAVKGYMETMVAPAGVLPAAHTAGKAAFAAVFQPTFEDVALVKLQAALLAYAALMIPPVGVAVPPPGPLTITFTVTSDGNAAATTIATAIDLWMRTGTYTVPPAAPVPWS